MVGPLAKIHCKHNFWQEDGPPPNGVLCLSTPEHNGKSGTATIIEDVSPHYGRPHTDALFLASVSRSRD